MSLAKASVSSVKAQSYSGKAVTPKPTVKLGGKKLKLNTDYKLTYKNNVRAGKATVVVTGINRYKGSIKKNYTIAYNIAKAKVSWAQPAVAYTGKAVTPMPIVVCGGTKLAKNTHYTLKYANNKKAGKATVSITAKGSLAMGARCATFTISNNLSAASISLPCVSYAYTGKPIMPVPVVKLGDTTLKAKTQYGITYQANKAAGTATLVVKGKGAFRGSKSKKFTIFYDLSKADVSLSQQSYPYVGTAITPVPKVTCAGAKLVHNTHFVCSYSANTAVGTGTVNINAKGLAKGAVKKTFKITAANIAGASVSVPKATCTYTGRSLAQEPTVKLGGITLKKDRDYTVEQHMNTNVGTAKVMVTGCGGYVGTAQTTFRIVPCDLTNAMIALPQGTYGYTGDEIKPVPSVWVKGIALKEGADYAVSYTANKDEGIATVTVAGRGNYVGTIDASFVITNKDLSFANVFLAQRDHAYTGDAIEPTPVVAIGGKQLTQGVDYDVSYQDNVEVGTAVVVVTGTGAYEGVCKKSFFIKYDLDSAYYHFNSSIPPTNSMLIPIGDYEGAHMARYTGAAIDFLESVGVGGYPYMWRKTLLRGVDYTVRYVSNVNVGMATVFIEPTERSMGGRTVEFTIWPNLVDAQVTLPQSQYSYTGSAICPEPIVKLYGNTLIPNKDYKVSYRNNIDRGTATLAVYYGDNPLPTPTSSGLTIVPDNTNYVKLNYYIT